MTKARCFNCHVGLPISRKTLEDLIKIKLPLFCSTSCSLEFPNNGTEEFKDKIKIMEKFIK